MKKLSLCFLLLVLTLPNMAHTGIGITQDYGNIRVHSYKETDREDFRKAFIIGQLANKLAQELHYTEPIFLDCWLGLLAPDSASTDYHISFQNYKYRDEEGEGSEKLIIRQQAKNYDVVNTLKLIEYAIKNKAIIKQQQQWLKSTFFYDRGEEKQSISKDIVVNILQQKTSKEINAVLHTRIERPLLPDEHKPRISYYWEDSQYYIYRNMKIRTEKEPRDVVLLTLPHIHQFENLDLAFLIFDTVSSFYYVNINHYDQDSGLNKVSSRHVIENIEKTDLGNKIRAISHGDVSIYINQGMILKKGETRLLLYFYETDTLVQDAYGALGITSKELTAINRESAK